MADTDTIPGGTEVDPTTLPATPDPTIAAPSAEAATQEPALSQSSASPAETSSPVTTISTEDPTIDAAVPAVASPTEVASTPVGPTKTAVELLIENLERYIASIEAFIVREGKLESHEAITVLKNLVKEIKLLGGKVEVDVEALIAKWL